MKIYSIKIASILFGLFALIACKEEQVQEPDPGVCEVVGLTPTTNVEGYGILEKLPGIWNGPVTSPTPLGSFPEWIVDFRPISASQVSAKNELDSLNDIFMSFFIVLHNNEYKMAFRNGGGFAGATRNSYMIIDSLNEGPTESFYRFSDPIAGGDRVYTDVRFKDDSIIMHAYTNQFNTLSTPVTHMVWRANLRNSTAKLDAIALFSFPQKELTRDFTTTFDGLTEAVFYSIASDPYPENEQPHLGVSNVSVNISNPAVVDPAKKVLIIVTTEPLFNGINFLAANLDTRSRYVLVGAEALTGYDFNYMHPGDYYVNAIYDENGDGNFSSGDYMNSSFDVPLSLGSQGTSSVNVNINFQVP
ncbi:MAG: hypothetical protein QNK23_13670 [Crocinitomicaceae bacterium]|nr:hypothetical protein [Crocinitomicaceae bacterium]